MIYLVGILGLITAIYFCTLVWVIVGFYNIRRTGKLLSSEVNKISVIIAARNEENSIVKCLESLKNQNYERTNFEVVIIDDHSTDNTKHVVNDFVEHNNLNIAIHSLGQSSSKKEALRMGIEKSQFDIIATTDADCVLPGNWLANISSQISETDMLLGPVMFTAQKGFLSAFQALDMMAIQGMEFGALSYQKPILNNAANLAYAKQAYADVSGFDNFDTPSGDDIFLLEKFKSKGKKVKGLLTEDFIVETPPKSTFSELLNQRLRWSSKAKYYSDKLLIYFSIIVLLQSISLIFIYLGIPFVEKYRIILIILLFCKWLIDFILLLLVAGFFNRRNVLFYYIPVQLVYPIYTVVVWIASITMKFEWKGRKF